MRLGTTRRRTRAILGLWQCGNWCDGIERIIFGRQCGHGSNGRSLAS
jgi:hypothetical protein